MTALRPPVVLGGLMVLAGTWALLGALGLLPAGAPVGPLLIIGAGVLVMSAGVRASSGSAAGAVEPVPVSVPVDGASSARLLLNHGAGTLRLRSGSQADLLIEGTSTSQLHTALQRAGERLDVTLQPTGAWDRWPGRDGAVVWDLHLSPGVVLDLEIRTGASQVRLDLTDLDVRSVKVQTGASDVEMVLPAHGRCDVSVSAGAADVRILVPEGVEASVRNRSALAGFSVDEVRFPRLGDRHQSPGFDHAADRADIAIDGGVASFSVR